MDERAVLVMTAIVDGRTPEAIQSYLAEGFPAHLHQRLELAGEREEMEAHLAHLARLLDS